MSIDIKVNRIHKFENMDKKLRAFADIEIDGVLLVKGLQIVQGAKGLFVSMPRQRGKNNMWHEIVRTVTPEAKQRISEVVLDAYQEGNNVLSNNDSNEQCT